MPHRKRASNIDIEVGERVRALRIKAGLSQTAVAAELGISYQQIQKYEVGINRIAPGRLAALAKLLRVPVATFYGEDNRGKTIELDTRLNTHTRRELIAALDKIKSPRLESILLTLTMEYANTFLRML